MRLLNGLLVLFIFSSAFFFSVKPGFGQISGAFNGSVPNACSIAMSVASANFASLSGGFGAPSALVASSLSLTFTTAPAVTVNCNFNSPAGLSVAFTLDAASSYTPAASIVGDQATYTLASQVLSFPSSVIRIVGNSGFYSNQSVNVAQGSSMIATGPSFSRGFNIDGNDIAASSGYILAGVYGLVQVITGTAP